MGFKNKNGLEPQEPNVMDEWIKKLDIPDVSKSVVCDICYGYGYTVDVYGRRKEHCNECE
jgi:hypothetical protein